MDVASNDFVSLKEMYMKTNIQILSSEPTSQRRHTWFEPMGDVLTAGDHHLLLDQSL